MLRPKRKYTLRKWSKDCDLDQPHGRFNVYEEAPPRLKPAPREPKAKKKSSQELCCCTLYQVETNMNFKRSGTRRKSLEKTFWSFGAMATANYAQKNIEDSPRALINGNGPTLSATSL